MTGTVIQISVSRGGIPKRAIPSGEVRTRRARVLRSANPGDNRGRETGEAPMRGMDDTWWERAKETMGRWQDRAAEWWREKTDSWRDRLQ